ncbi:hypothetical protein CABS01_11737 [Colletotrichum abscissum]|uniref:Uncharacterized protein n=1 Tax=Colletotrichum abscissum TaxID=1671311 RepID=A0A9Q0B340_9PEZI|nr:uncharacterized protein CABS01_11737 [Colletotrichum abscissum]KAI3548680.1 hypothetical protein CABS02_08210 [Colletotrichum abscissum]KAK1492840.1 hypothetical protein CABS01_11737 [Colletotrichum abscissum]
MASQHQEVDVRDAGDPGRPEKRGSCDSHRQQPTPVNDKPFIVNTIDRRLVVYHVDREMSEKMLVYMG